MNYFNYTGQRWEWHRFNMPKGVYDEDIKWIGAYQISSYEPFEGILIMQ
jgi:hypothetical protein